MLQAGVFSFVALLSIVYGVLGRWLGGSFAKLGFSLGLCGFANVPPKSWAKNPFLFV
jgi:hypothetical protein